MISLGIMHTRLPATLVGEVLNCRPTVAFHVPRGFDTLGA